MNDISNQFVSPRRVWWIYCIFPLFGALSLATGTSITVVILQILNLSLIVFIWNISDKILIAARLAFIFPFVKLYGISQFVKLLYWQPADSGLSQPIETNFILLVGLLSTLTTVGLILFFDRNFISWFNSWRVPFFYSKKFLYTVGFSTLLIGLAFTIIYRSSIGQSSVLFAYGARLVYFSLVAFAVATFMSTSGKNVNGPISIVVLLIVLGLALLTGVKTELLLPIFVMIGLYLHLGRFPNFMAIFASMAVILFMAQYLHPAVNYARSINAGAAAAETAKTLSRMITDSNFARDINNESDRIEEGWATRLYYLEPAGFLNRFTPNQVDDVAQGVANGGTGSLAEYLRVSFISLMPQTLFGERSAAGTLAMVSTVARGAYSDGTDRPNYGVLASLFAFANPAIAAILYSCCLVMVYLATRTLTLVLRAEAWALAVMPLYALSLADSDFGSFLITVIHGTVLQGVIFLPVVVLARMSTRSF